MPSTRKQRVLMRKSKAHSPETEEQSSHLKTEQDSTSAVEMRQAVMNPRQASAATILSMQSSYGNQAVQRMLSNSKIQRQPGNVIQRDDDGSGSWARKMFLPSSMQKTAKVASGKDNSEFLKQVQENEKVFAKEQGDVDQGKKDKEAITNLKMDLKMEKAKPNPDKAIITQLEHQISAFKRVHKDDLDTGDADDAEKYTGYIGDVTGMGNTVNSVTQKGIKYLGDKTSPILTQYDNSSSNNRQITQVGTASQGDNIVSSVGNLAGIAGDISGLVSTISTMKSGNEAQREKAGSELTDRILSFGQTLYSTAMTGMNMAGDWGGTAMANQMMAEVPILGIGANALQFIQITKDLIQQAIRLHKERGLVGKAREKNDPVLKASLMHLRNRDIQLVADNTVKEIVVGLKLAANVCSLTGIGVTVGVPLSTAATALGAANKVAHMLADSYRAGLVNEKRKQYQENKDKIGTDDNAKGLAGDASKVLISKDAKQAVQTLVSKGRDFVKAKKAGLDMASYEKEEIAWKAIKLYGVTETMLLNKSIPDSDIRALILAKLGESEDPKNLADKLVDAANKASGKMKELKSKPSHVRLVAGIKDLLNYGGKSGRLGTTWVSNGFFGKNVAKLQSQIKHLATKLNNGQLIQLHIMFPEGSAEWTIYTELDCPKPTVPERPRRRRF